MNAAPLPDLRTALSVFRQRIHSGDTQVEELCELGLILRHLNRPTESKRCFQAAVEIMHRTAAARDVEGVVYLETLLYETFVKTLEDERHYRRCFGAWQDELAALGQSHYDPDVLQQRGGGRLAFILPAGTLLGHTEVLFTMLEHHRSREAPALPPRIYVLFQHGKKFLERAHTLGVEVFLAETELPGGKDAPSLDRFLWLRERLRRDGCTTAVWVSVPTLATLVLSMRVAPVQIYWALRFHPISGSFIDGYITYGPKANKELVFDKQSWRVCPVPLTMNMTPPEASAVARLRAQFRESVLFGTLARTDKIDSKPFLASVAAILKANPGAGYLWTGKERHPGIEAFFQSHGVADRCHFVGWVDTVLYAHALDVFLETFPFGCGITGYQALGAGTPLLSYLEKNTVFGMHFGQSPESARPGKPDLSGYPLLCATTPEEYVALGNRLAADADYRRATGEQGKRFFEEEVNNAPRYADRFFETIAEITNDTLAERGPSR